MFTATNPELGAPPQELPNTSTSNSPVGLIVK